MAPFLVPRAHARPSTLAVGAFIVGGEAALQLTQRRGATGASAIVHRVGAALLNATAIDESYFHELMTALGSLHAAQGWAAPSWASLLPSGVAAPAAGAGIRAVHLAILRERMDAVLAALRVASGPYLDDPVRSGGTLNRAAHITALQQRAQ